VSIGARFLEIRKAKGLKQTDVAEAIGISHGALVNYEKGREPPASAILAFSQVYGVSANWLLTGEGRPDAEPGQHLCPFNRDRLGLPEPRRR
jgi:transcriptional regulator with XRE-family HTH domain